MANTAQIVTEEPDVNKSTKIEHPAQPDKAKTEALYLIRHVNFGSDDSTPSSKFEIEFSCSDYIQARAIFDLVVSSTKYKPSKLILSHKHTSHLSQISVPYRDGLPSLAHLSGFSSAHKDKDKDKKGALIPSLKNQPVTVHRGRTSGSKGTATGYGYLAPVLASAKQVFLFHKDQTSICPDTAIKSELILEVLIGPDRKWCSAKYVELLDYRSQAAILLHGIIETLKQYVVRCPYCDGKDCFVEKLVREIEVEPRCAVCESSFYVTLFE